MRVNVCQNLVPGIKKEKKQSNAFNPFEVYVSKHELKARKNLFEEEEGKLTKTLH